MTQPQQKRQQEWRNKRVCLDHLKGICQEKRWKCKYAHPPLQLAQKPASDAQVCEVWMLTGSCKFGSSCRDYHPELSEHAPCAPAKLSGPRHKRQNSFGGSETGFSSSSSSDESAFSSPVEPPKPLAKQDYTLDQVIRKVNGILNKLTQEKFDSLLRQLFELVSADQSEVYLERVLPLVVAKAISEQQMSGLYATMVKHLYGLVGVEERPVVQRQLMQLCDRLLQETADLVGELSGEQQAKLQDKRLGNVQFLAQLFLEGVVPLEEIQSRLNYLTERMTGSEGSVNIQLVCRFLTVVGTDLPSSTTGSILQKLVEASARNSQRIQFMVHDLLDSRFDGWSPMEIEFSPGTPTTPSSSSSVSEVREVFVHNPYGFSEISYRIPVTRVD